MDEPFEEQTRPLPCIVCDKELTPVFPEQDRAQPDVAVMFSGYGQYGSTVFDPQDDSKLYINICDDCLIAKGNAGAIWHARYVKRPALTLLSRQWKPDPAVDGE